MNLRLLVLTHTSYRCSSPLVCMYLCGLCGLRSDRSASSTVVATSFAHAIECWPSSQAPLCFTPALWWHWDPKTEYADLHVAFCCVIMSFLSSRQSQSEWVSDIVEFNVMNLLVLVFINLLCSEARLLVHSALWRWRCEAACQHSRSACGAADGAVLSTERRAQSFQINLAAAVQGPWPEKAHS